MARDWDFSSKRANEGACMDKMSKQIMESRAGVSPALSRRTALANARAGVLVGQAGRLPYSLATGRGTRVSQDS